MKKTLALVLIVLVTLLIGVAIGAIGTFALFVPNQVDEAVDLQQAVVENADAGPAERNPALEDAAAVPLDIGNTTIGFSCAKTVGGKTLLVRGGWGENFGSELEGRAMLDTQTGEPLALDARIRVDSLWSEHDDLTKALLTQGFFSPGEHPYATFESTAIEPATAKSAAGPDVTHVVTGRFTLNGQTKTIRFPARITTAGGRLTIASDFSIDRHAFGVAFAEGAGFGLLTDEDIADLVAITLRVETDVPATVEPGRIAGGEGTAAPDADAAEVAAAVPADAQARPEVAPVEAAPTAPVASDLPTTYTETIPSSQVQFDMVLVPAGGEPGAQPFYMGKHEVTWDEFMPWVEGRDLASESQIAELRAMKLRPSAPYGSVDRGFGMHNRPALGMSQLSAELYCQWLSEQTGRTYRLPTEAEWERAYRLGGGDPDSPMAGEQAQAQATYFDNAWSDTLGDWSTTRVGENDPNALGIHDLAGNVAEWVTTGEEAGAVRGGHFESDIAELGVGRAAEDQSVWNRDYPNEPKSQWWYVNARWVGFRVVSEPPDASPQ